MMTVENTTAPLSYHGGRLAIADSGNNRVTVWGVEP